MVLVNGRNLGDLPGLKIYTAPKKRNKARQNDTLIVLMTCVEGDPQISDYETWGKIISDEYFQARGSFTMGISSAVRVFASYLNQQYPGTSLPKIVLNMIVFRENTVLVAHAGAVNTTIVYADRVDNFSDMTSQDVSVGSSGVRYFQVEIHAGDLILLCPFVPEGWTNKAILDATAESPLNVVRYLLDQVHGNLQGAVIQVKAGKGKILYRYKMPISTTIDLEYMESETNDGLETVHPGSGMGQTVSSISPVSSPSYLLRSEDEKTRPLFRVRLPLEPFPVGIKPKKRLTPRIDEEISELQPENDLAEPCAGEEQIEPMPEEIEGESPELTPEVEEAVGVTSIDIPVSDSIDDGISIETEIPAEKELDRSKKHSVKTPKSKKEKKRREGARVSWKRILLGLTFGILIPIVVVFALFIFYNNRSKDAVYREGLQNAVDTAEIALKQTEPSLVRISWEKVLEYLDDAEQYGVSDAAQQLRSQAQTSLDELEYGTPIKYQFALSKALASNVKITRLESSGQFLYALDENAGEIMRFNVNQSGLTLDPTFTCKPGNYRNRDSTDSTDIITVGKLVDFVLLPSESGLERVIAGIDNQAQVLMCQVINPKVAYKMETPPIGWLGVDAIHLIDRVLYVLDSKNNAIWKFAYIGKEGFITAPQSYFGSNSPNLNDSIDFMVYANYAYILRQTGSMIVCDYTGYIAMCSYVDELKSADGSKTISLLNRNLFQMQMNSSPDNSLYMMDTTGQSILNATVKMNLVRNLVPDRFTSVGNRETPTAFGFLDPTKIVWAAGNMIFVGSIL
jgi:hypothetical protein